jgi:hypothetical protein
MDNRLNLKINTSIIIFLAFIFRLSFVNIYLLPSLKTSKTNTLISLHFSTIFKRRRNIEISKSNFDKYADIEACEENLNSKENPTKINSRTLLSILYFLFGKTVNSTQSNNPFDDIKCNLYPKRYLAFSVLKI